MFGHRFGVDAWNIARPAVFLISAYQAEKQGRAEDESTAFHETIPGHHLQIAIAVERKQIHRVVDGDVIR